MVRAPSAQPADGAFCVNLIQELVMEMTGLSFIFIFWF